MAGPLREEPGEVEALVAAVRSALPSSNPLLAEASTYLAGDLMAERRFAKALSLALDAAGNVDVTDPQLVPDGPGRNPAFDHPHVVLDLMPQLIGELRRMEREIYCATSKIGVPQCQRP